MSVTVTSAAEMLDAREERAAGSSVITGYRYVCVPVAGTEPVDGEEADEDSDGKSPANGIKGGITNGLGNMAAAGMTTGLSSEVPAGRSIPGTGIGLIGS